MNFETIETERLVLSGLSPEAMKQVFDHHSKPEIMRLLGHRSEEEYAREEKKQRAGYASYNRSFLLFLMRDTASGTIIGRCGLHNWNEGARRAEVGYAMEEEAFKRKGLMTEALGAVIDYGFNTLHLNRIEGIVGVGNVPSLRLMEKFGFIREGLLRQHVCKDGVYEDSIFFSKLHEEYAAEERR